MSRKEALVAVLRRFHLLRFADGAKLKYLSWRNRRRRSTYAARHPDFALPPDDLAYDAYGSIDWEAYRSFGHETAEWIASLIRRHAWGDRLDVLEWGCGPGRVIRHLPDLLGNRATVHGVDYNPRTIDWCRRKLSDVRFETNTLDPPLPYARESFDAIYAISVFTHLSATRHDSWMRELQRVLRPGGLLVLTTQGHVFRDRHLTPDEAARFDAGRLVTRERFPEGKKFFSAFHSPEYVRAQLVEGLDEVEYRPGEEGGFSQDVWVVRKPVPATMRAAA